MPHGRNLEKVNKMKKENLLNEPFKFTLDSLNPSHIELYNPNTG